MMRQLTVGLIDQNYDIFIGSNIAEQLANQLLASSLPGDNLLIVSNPVIAKLYLEKIKRHFPSKRILTYLVADGEQEKNLTNFSLIHDFLIKHQFRRNDCVMALGGGVIGDLSGFVAATYQRGMQLLQVPTSLLAQVDSSVGGKTAVNHLQGKNLIGAFYQPQAVLIDPEYLTTLPDREFVSGLAEIIKYAIIGDENINRILKDYPAQIRARDKDVMTELIYFSCAKKAEMVSQDEKELSSRALLNLGHTFGHAIEKVTDYKVYLHGEAVALGIQMAINLSLAKDLISGRIANEYRELIASFGLPNKPFSKLNVNDIIQAMKLDKKNLNSQFRLVLPTDNGCKIVEESQTNLIGRAIKQQMN